MHNVRTTTVGLGAAALAVALVGTLAVAQQPTKTQATAKPATPPKKPDFPPLDSVVKGMQAKSAPADEKPFFYDFYYYLKKGKLLAEIPSSQLNKPFLLYVSIAGGTYTGFQWEDFMLKWERRDKRLLLVQPEVRYKAKGGELAEVVRRTYTDTILTTVPIVTMGRKGPVIDIGALLGRGASTFVGSLAGGTDASLMKFPAPKAFAQNVEIEITLPRVGGSSGRSMYSFLFGSQGSSNLTVHYSISVLPKTGYKPRLADDRIGYFLTAIKDFSKDPRDETRFVRYVNRWHLEKEDPKAEVSLAKNPIVFYVEKTVPKKYRRWVHEGIEEWNKAFEKVGILKAIVVRQQTDTQFAEFDPADRRFNFFRWITSDTPFAMGPSRVHPETGEILDADIIFDDSFLRYWLQEYDMLIRDEPATALSPRLQQCLERQPWRHPMRRWIANDPVSTTDERDKSAAWLESELPMHSARLCRLGVGMRHQLMFGLTAHQVLVANAAKECEKKDKGKAADKDKKKSPTTTQATTAVAAKDEAKKDEKPATQKTADTQAAPSKKKADEFPEEYIGQVLREVVMHEVGHTLGLRHNFKASSWLTLEEINKRKETGEPTVGSVMDYNPTNVSPEGEAQGSWNTTTIGPYDYWAIEYGYTAKGDEKNLKKIASRAAEAGLDYATDEDVYHSDPLVNRYDLGKEPLDYSRQRVKLVRQILDKLVDAFVKEGEGYQRVRRGFDMLLYDYRHAAAIAAKYIGGHYATRDHKGDPNARPPVQVVEPDKQRTALAFLRDEVFSDKAFRFPPELIQHLAAGRWRHWGSRDVREPIEYPIHDRILQIQLWTLFDVLNGETLAHLHDAEMRARRTPIS